MFGANMGLGAAANPVASFVKSPEFAKQLAEKYGTQTAGAASPAGSFGASMEKAINAPDLIAQRGADITSSAIAKAPTIAAPAAAVGPTAQVGGGAQFTGGLGSRFGQAVRAGLPEGTPKIISRLAPMMAANGVMSGISGALTPSGGGSVGDDGVIDNSYAGPYTAQIREVSYPGESPITSRNSSDHLYFSNSMPEVYNAQGQVVQPGSSTARGTPIMQNVLNTKAKKGQNRYNQILTPYMQGYADGGEIHLEPNGFVIDARTVSERGNGYTGAGQKEFAKLGGIPLNGPGDGVSDSIKARIGDQPARVAAGEVYMPPAAVKRAGGAVKLYAMMDKAHKATKRGQETKLRSGLG
jgi:hypothetical protein